MGVESWRLLVSIGAGESHALRRSLLVILVVVAFCGVVLLASCSGQRTAQWQPATVDCCTENYGAVIWWRNYRPTWRRFR